MKKVIIIHGFNATPNGGWRAWLMGELAALDVYACALPMPSPEAPSPDAWVEEIRRVVEREAPGDVCLVGHSLGVPAILRYLERGAEAVAGAVLVSGPIEPIAVNHVIAPFLAEPFDFPKIRSRIGRVAVIHAHDDDRVPFSQGERLARELGAELIAIPNGGHLNGKSGWTELPQALEALKTMLD
jgi:predicted alpha/beta hydrolase family esterase